MTFLYEGIRQLMELLYGICGDYGIAIVWITVMIRLCMAPLNQKQRQIQNKQRKLALQTEELKKKYGNDKGKMSLELEKLYREKGAGSMGCILPLLQFPIMIALYNGIRRAVVADAGTVLLPWIPSLLLKDSSYILPAITVLMQMLPQFMPYFGFFQSLHLEKMSIPMMLVMLLMNGWFACMLPAGMELYYMASGLFAAAEQAVCYSLRLCENQ